MSAVIVAQQWLVFIHAMHGIGLVVSPFVDVAVRWRTISVYVFPLALLKRAKWYSWVTCEFADYIPYFTSASPNCLRVHETDLHDLRANLPYGWAVNTCFAHITEAWLELASFQLAHMVLHFQKE